MREYIYCYVLVAIYFLNEKQNEVSTQQTTPPGEQSKEINQETQLNNHKTEQDTKSVCPECGEPMSFEGGCVICKACGYSKCE